MDSGRCRVNLVDEADRAQALTVPCPLTPCFAPAGEPCRNLRDGQPLEHMPAHAARLKAAGVVHAPVPSSELADPDARRGGRW